MDKNTKKRIRLSLDDCKIISKALHIFNHLPTFPPKDEESIQRIIDMIWEKDGELKKNWLLISDLSRRFHCLSSDDGFYARSSRR
jgi:hypothetical protein